MMDKCVHTLIAQWIGSVLDMSDDSLESGHAFTIVQEQRDDRGQ